MKISTSFLPFLTVSLSLLPSVYAHGMVARFGVDGKVYAGNFPGGKSEPSPIRAVTSQDPIYGTTNPTVNCGTGAPNAALVVDAMPGSKLTWDWQTQSQGPWPHDMGPLMTYLASCGSTTCDQFDSRTAEWFKIDQAGQDNNGGWVQKQLMDGKNYSANLPKNLAAGDYLVRHEIIALHLGNEKGKAEFYPSCQQIRVGGSETGVPTKDQLLSFPGAYTEDDPGIYTPAIFDGGFKYTFPGGPIATLTTSSGGGNTNGTNTSIPSSSTRRPTSTTNIVSPAVPTGTGDPGSDGSSSCSLKNNRSLLKRSNQKKRSSGQTRPHRVSRVMGRMFHGNTW